MIMNQSTADQNTTLVPINLNNLFEVEELQRQRVICGWDYDIGSINLWKEKQEQGVKSFFWITIVPPETSGVSPAPQTEPKPIRAGHISLDSYCHPPDPELASADKSNMTIQTFFILPEYRGARLGSRVMDLLESMATKEPHGSPACKYITLNSMSKKYFYEDTPEGRFMQETIKFSNEEWYERRGYAVWKAEPRYDYILPDGTEVKLTAVFMRKKVA